MENCVIFFNSFFCVKAAQFLSDSQRPYNLRNKVLEEIIQKIPETFQNSGEGWGKYKILIHKTKRVY